jgi:hypothetical protein
MIVSKLALGFPLLASLPKPVLLLILLSIGVGGSFLIYQRMSSPHQTVIAFHKIPTAGATGYSQPANLVINDNETWVKVWTTAYHEGPPYCTQPPQPPPLGGYPCEPAPSVNFTTRTMIAVFMGAQPNPGYTIKITQIVQSGSNIVVHLLSTKAGSCGYDTEGRWPSYIVDIPKTEAHITFTTETIICTVK